MLTVKARAGVNVPMEHDPRRYVAEAPVTVPNTTYYLRRIHDGDLVIVPEGGCETYGEKDNG